MKSNEELILTYDNNNTYTHLSRSGEISKGLEVQLFAWGYNASGRPDGLWVSRGNSWLKYTVENNDPRFPPCCYLYEVTVPNNILTVTSDNFVHFDSKYPNYWINLDYYDVNFIDKVTGNKFAYKRRLDLDFTKLHKTSMQSLYNILLNNGIIFESAEEAASRCNFYKGMSADLIDRFRYKNWELIANDYAGILFEYDYNSTELADRYFWYQTLGMQSGCIWDTRNIIMELKYIKKQSKWKYNI